MGMSREETMNTRYGEFMDLLACKMIESGSAKQKPPKRKLSIFEALAIR